MSALQDFASNWRQLEQEWKKTEESWRDSAARYFDQHLWRSIESDTTRHILALDELERVLEETRAVVRQLAR